MTLYNIKYPHEVANPKRYLNFNKRDLVNFFNSNNGVTNLYIGVYNYLEFREPYMYPIYETAIIDRIYFDFDKKVKENGEVIKLNAYENMIKVHNWCVERDILHFPQCTGSAYDIIIATDPNEFIQNKKQCVANAQRWLCKELDIKMDPQVIGDISRVHRMENTFNIKSSAKRYAIPLDKDIIYKGEEFIFEIAKKQRFTNNSYGNKYWNIKKFDAPESIYKDEMYIKMPNIDFSQFSDISENIPDCIKILLNAGDIGWKERRIVILGLKENCYTIEETIEILKKYLTPKKFNHCVYSEKQPQYLYKHDKYFFPTKNELMQLGICSYKEDCNKCKFGCKLYMRE